MGLIRKTVSVSSLGIVRYRNGEERTRHVAKQTRNAARLTAAGSVATAKYTRQAVRQPVVVEQQVVFVEPQLPPPGWYVDPQHGQWERWWDGQAWSHQQRALVTPTPWDAHRAP